MVKIKGKSKCLSLYDKAKIIEDANKGMSVTSLSNKYGIAKSTVCSIKSKKEKIVAVVSNTLKPSQKCTLKSAECPNMEKQLYKWFLSQRERNMPVSGEMIKKKAITLCSALNTGDFHASDGWLQRFKERYGIRFLTITGEKLSSQPELVDPFKQKLNQVIEEFDLTYHQLYNADETGLYWQLLPKKTYVSLAEKTASGMKLNKRRITFLGCANASGTHKLRPLIIGKSKNPRCLKNFINPLIYRSTKNAWMTGELFKNWFFQQFVPEVKEFLHRQNLPMRAVLLLDNAPSHPPAEELKSSDRRIFVLFMPPNVTPLIQPMDQNILRLTKLYYRNSLLTSIMTGEEMIGDALKKVTLKEAVIHLTAAWEKVSPEIIEKCWHNLLGKPNQQEDEDNLPLSVLQQRVKESKTVSEVMVETVTLLQAIGPAEYTFEDVEDWNKDYHEDLHEEQSEESDSVVQEEEIPKIAHTEAIHSLKVAIEWAKQNKLNISQIINLKNILETAVVANISAKRTQSKITSYFSVNPL